MIQLASLLLKKVDDADGFADGFTDGFVAVVADGFLDGFLRSDFLSSKSLSLSLEEALSASSST